MSGQLLNRKEAASFLGISIAMLDKLVAQGKLPVVRFCRKPLFRIEDLETFIQEHLQKNGKN